jgi:hypothetical protein
MLYRNIKLERYYAGSNEQGSIYKTDYASYKEQCEIAIGCNTHMPEVRKEINENFEKAKKKVKIELILAIISIAVFFIL